MKTMSARLLPGAWLRTGSVRPGEPAVRHAVGAAFVAAYDAGTSKQIPVPVATRKRATRLVAIPASSPPV